MYKDKVIGVVVPAYNEEGLVGNVIEAIPSFVDRVYVIDDASTDRTWDEIQRRALRANVLSNGDGRMISQRIVTIKHEENKGVGGAIKTGYLRAREDSIDVTAVMAGDGQMDPKHLKRVIDPVATERAAYAKGDRTAPEAGSTHMPSFRHVGNSLLTVVTRMASGYWTLNDSQNGFTAISKRALEQVAIEEMYDYYGYCNDLLVKLNVNNLTVVDVPVPITYGDEQSHIQYLSYVPRVSAMLLYRFLWRLEQKHLFGGFNPVGLCYLYGAVTYCLVALDVIRSAFDETVQSDRNRVLTRVLRGGLLLALAVVFDYDSNAHFVESILHDTDTDDAEQAHVGEASSPDVGRNEQPTAERPKPW